MRRISSQEPAGRLGLSGRCLVAAAAAMAVSAGWAVAASDDGPENGVVRIRRGGGSAGGAVYSARRAAVRAAAEAEGDGESGGERGGSGAMLAASGLGGGGITDGGPELVDTDPVAPGLPDAAMGEPDPAPVSEPIIMRDARVRGEQIGRTVRFIGAEVVFADIALDARYGTPIGFNGVMGVVGPNAGSAPVVEFELPAGAEVTLRVQSSALNPNAPSRRQQVVTLQVP
ncbi:MAG: hypothetical protein R3B68_05530 [Phycisphaerales bacterium]